MVSVVIDLKLMVLPVNYLFVCKLNNTLKDCYEINGNFKLYEEA